MGFIEELKWRGLLHDMTPGMEEALANGSVRAYIGFDPTAPSLTIGNFVPIMILKLFQDAGHQPVVLMGGATGRVGDPSGKDEERKLLDYSTLDHNLAHQQAQFAKFLRFDDSDTSAIVVNNYDFYKEMSILDFLRDVGKRITVNYMMSKDSVKNRLEKGLSFTEFSYQLLQGYDFQHLYEHMDCKIQMGGSDQWGNITGGTELIRRNLGGKAFALTCPLLTKKDGKKFGKTEKGNIWLDPTMTSPYQFYQFWLNASDEDVKNYIRIFTFLEQEEILKLEAEHAENPGARVLQKKLAEVVTIYLHGEEELKKAIEASAAFFSPTIDGLKALDTKTLGEVLASQKKATVNKSELNGMNMLELLSTKTGFLASNGEARRALKENSVSINKSKIVEDYTLSEGDLISGKYVLVQRGKKKFFVLEIAD